MKRDVDESGEERDGGSESEHRCVCQSGYRLTMRRVEKARICGHLFAGKHDQNSDNKIINDDVNAEIYCSCHVEKNSVNFSSKITSEYKIIVTRLANIVGKFAVVEM